MKIHVRLYTEDLLPLIAELLSRKFSANIEPQDLDMDFDINDDGDPDCIVATIEQLAITVERQ